MNRLKQLREERKLTLRELSEIIHIDKSSLSRFENGEREPRTSVIVDIANFFNVSLDYLLGQSEIRNPEKLVYRETEPTLDETLQREMEGFEYALFGEVKDLNEEQKEDLLTMVRLFKKNLRD